MKNPWFRLAFFPFASRGFTLIELLIVVAIISVLAAIATPNFMEAQTRAKVARVLNDARVVATALESYHVDNARYPYRTIATRLGGALKYPIGRCDNRIQEMRVLTTPISYVSNLPKDIFESRVPQPNNILDYWSVEITREIFKSPIFVPDAMNKNPGWVIVSAGPDGSIGYFGNLDGCPPGDGDPASNTCFTAYDPTNGTVSVGNVFRLQSGGEAGMTFSGN